MAEISRSARSASRPRVRRTVSAADPDEPSDVEVGWRLEDGQSADVRGGVSRPRSLLQRRLGALSGGTRGRSTTRVCTGQPRRGPTLRTSLGWSSLACSMRTSTRRSRASSRNRSDSLQLSAVNDESMCPTTCSRPMTGRSSSTSSPRRGWATPRLRPRWRGRSVSSSRARAPVGQRCREALGVIGKLRPHPRFTTVTAPA